MLVTVTAGEVIGSATVFSFAYIGKVINHPTHVAKGKSQLPHVVTVCFAFGSINRFTNKHCCC